jgi:hypothetical protein
LKALYFAYEQSEILGATVNENKIVDWILRKFSKLEIKIKMLLIQYSRLGLDTTEVAEKKKVDSCNFKRIR